LGGVRARANVAYAGALGYSQLKNAGTWRFIKQQLEKITDKG